MRFYLSLKIIIVVETLHRYCLQCNNTNAKQKQRTRTDTGADFDMTLNYAMFTSINVIAHTLVDKFLRDWNR